MTFWIRHEKFSILVPLILAFLLLTCLSCVCLVRDMIFWLIVILILQIAVITLFTVENYLKTEITVTDADVTIRRLYSVKQFAVSEIADMQIERYTKYRRCSVTEHRMRMRVRLTDGRTVVLNDSAAPQRGLVRVLLNSGDALPDEDVALYQAYLMIQSKRK